MIKGKPYKVILAEKHAIIRRGVSIIIQGIDNLEVVGEVDNPVDLLEMIKRMTVNLIITDLFPDLKFLELILEIKIINPKLRILILTSYNDKGSLYRSLAAGADGYLLKEDLESELKSAIKTLLKGGTFISPLLSTHLADLSMQESRSVKKQLFGPEPERLLTDTEMQILKLFAERKSITEIGKMLHIGIGAVRRYRRNIMQKLHFNTTVEFYNFANKYAYIGNLEYSRTGRASKLDEENGNNKPFILRSIEFAPEHHEAGLTILSYFGNIVRQKYAGMKVKISIEQEDLTVRMIIQTDEGNIEKIEKTLEEYGLVIKGEMPITEFISDPYQVLELKQQLRIAHLQLENQKELLAVTKNMHEERIFNLEEQVRYFHSHIGNGLKLLENRDIILDSAISFIENKLEKGINKDDILEIKEALKKILTRDKSIFDKIVDKINVLIIQGSISGIAGNALYDFIKPFLKIF
jgi:DNA-binding NarL/FixJ family response regulator